MTQEEKELLLKDLCARLPYGVKVQITCNDTKCEDFGKTAIARVIGILLIVDDDKLNHYTVLSQHDTYHTQGDDISEVKPYLRPMSSMTEEEEKEYELFANHCILTSIGFVHIESQILIDWLNSHHFDYRELIERGLALPAKKGMYKTE